MKKEWLNGEINWERKGDQELEARESGQIYHIEHDEKTPLDQWMPEGGSRT
jgi:hypothetical protein